MSVFSRIPIIISYLWYLCRRIKKGFHHTSIILLFLTVPQNLGWSYYSSFSRVEGSFLLLDVKNTRNFIRSAQSGRINSEGTYFKLDFARARDFGVCLASPSFPFDSVRLVLSIALLSMSITYQLIAIKQYVINNFTCSIIHKIISFKTNLMFILKRMRLLALNYLINPLMTIDVLYR